MLNHFSEKWGYGLRFKGAASPISKLVLIESGFDETESFGIVASA